MKSFLSATARFFAEIWADAMLAALLFVPLFMGLLFRFGVPALESYLCLKLGRPAVLAPYYPIFDLLLCVMTPLMSTAAGAMVILDEADFGLARAISVTPVGRRGYLASRIGVPALLATAYCVIISFTFQLSGIGPVRRLLLAVCAGALSVAAALMICCMARNKVEGLAYTKLSGLFLLGLPAALLVPAPAKYVSAFLPSFWMTGLAMGESLLNAVPALLTSLIIAALFIRRFLRRVLA